MRRYRDGDEDEALIARSEDQPRTPLLAAVNGETHAEPLVHTGVEAAPAWAQMSGLQRSSVYLTFGLLGMGVLLPFNSLITPAEYFRSSFASTSYANTFSSWIVVSYNVISILVGIHATATGGFERSSPRRRIVLSSSAIVLAVVLFAISTTVGVGNVSSNQTYFFLTLSLGALLSSACAYLQNSVVSLSTAFGGRGAFMGSMLAGQGVVGVGISIFGLVSAWSQQDHHKSAYPNQSSAADETARSIARAATIFFSMNACLMLLVLAAFIWLANTKLYAQIMAEQAATIDKLENLDSGADDPEDASSDSPMEQSWHSIRSVTHPAYGSFLKAMPGFDQLPRASRESLLRIALVQSRVRWDCFAVAFVFVVTLSLFPALTSAVQSVYTGSSHPSSTASLDLTSPQLFVPFHFLLFNISDLLGRTLPSISSTFLIRKTTALVSLSLARVAFIPLFTACHVVSSSQRTGPITQQSPNFTSPHAHSWLASVLQSSDAPFFALVLLLGFSNGLVSTCIMIAGPTRSKLVNYKGASEGPLAATLLSFWLCVGLAIGSGLSFLTL